MKIILGSDHAGHQIKEHIKNYLLSLGHEVEDAGSYDETPIDYPDPAVRVSEGVSEGLWERGILVCGTGIGMSITANKVPGVRAALVSEPTTAGLSRAHNDANVLCLAGWFTGAKLSELIVDTWLETEYEGGKHAPRLDKIARLERREKDGGA